MGGVQGVASILEVGHGFPPFAARLGHTKKLVEARVEPPASLPVQGQIHEDPPGIVAVAKPLTGLGEFDDPLFDFAAGEFADSVGEPSGGRDTERLSEDSIGGGEELRRERGDPVGVPDGIGAQRDAPFVDPHEEAEAAAHTVVAGGEIGEVDAARALGPEPEGGGGAFAGSEVAKFHPFVAEQDRAADGELVERDADEIRFDVSGVQERDRRLVRFAGTHGQRVREGH